VVTFDLAMVCGQVVTLALAPFWALASVWDSALPRGARLVAWAHLSIAFALIWTLPLHAASIVVAGASAAPAYSLAAPVFGLASLVLGLRISRVHRRRMAGELVGAPLLGIACLAFAGALAIALSPDLFGAAARSREVPEASKLAIYLATILPLVLAMAFVAWMLLPNDVVTRAGACMALLGILAAPLLLHASRCHAAAPAKHEHVARQS
jgi:hypothetical protein